MKFPVSLKLFITLAAMAMIQTVLAASPAPQKAILITGASSGIGLNMTKHLAAEGYWVYAGARKEEDLIALGKIPNVQSIRLDVTKQEDIDNAVKTVTEAGRGLYGLINNAGVSIYGPLVETDEKDFDFIMNVNVYGPYRITKAFSPLIIEAKGRIIMTGSLFGTMTMPLLGPYAMSKHAIEAFTDTLAAEMAPYGVKVSVLEPGAYKSEIYRNTYNRAVAEQKDSGAELAEWQKQFFAQGPTEHDHYPPPDKVAEAASLALSAENPKRRYLVVPDEQQAKSTISEAIKKVVQLNADQDFTYDRATLVKMLDNTIKRQEQLRAKK